MNVTPKLGKGLGRKRDRYDARDLLVYGAGVHVVHGGAYQLAGAPLPSHADVFTGLNLPVYDQGARESCTANAGVLYRRFLAQKFTLYSAPDTGLSRLFLYYQERKLPWNNDVSSDAGASIRDIFYTLAHTGVCPAVDDPYNPAGFASAQDNDSPEDRAVALAYRIGAYHRVLDVNTARSVLASGYAFVLGFSLYSSFESIGPEGIMPMPASGETILGGHAVVIRGYDDASALFYAQNSWGADWGDAGCFWMPYAFLENAHLSQPDMWMGHLGKPWR